MDDSFSSAIFPYLEFKLRVNRPQEGRSGHCVAKTELTWEGGWSTVEADNE